MITLERARFTNFRSLRDVEITFASQPGSHLTVIRAENGTGKTSMLYALTWCLFGERTFAKRARYQISPIDWDVDRDGDVVHFSVEVEFSVQDEDHGQTKRYVAIRSGSEVLNNGGFTVEPEYLKVLRHTPQGLKALDDPNDFLNAQLLPIAYKNIFFTDSDVALDYIEADTLDSKRRNIREAVRSLLGIEVLEKAQIHIGESRKRVLQAMRNEAVSKDLKDATDRESRLQTSIERLFVELGELETQISEAERVRKKADEKLNEVLAAGGADEQSLRNKRESLQAEIAAIKADMSVVEDLQRARLNGSDLLNLLGRDRLRRNIARFERMKEDRLLPNTLPEIIRERLDKGTCICGASLEPGTDGHKNLSAQLASSDKADAAHGVLTQLASETETALRQMSSPTSGWLADAKERLRELRNLERQLETREAEYRENEAQVQKVRGLDIAVPREQLKSARAELQALYSEKGRLSERLSVAEQDFQSATQKRKVLERKQAGLRRRQAQEQAADDLLFIVTQTIQELQGETLDRISIEMNDIFMHIITSTPEGEQADSLIIQKVELTRDFDIKIHGPQGRLIDPDNGPSGAQRRALTLAFISALVRVSGERAPNVIDTPLGMTSGALRRSYLKYAIGHSSQLILFLTRDEIRGVEDILEAAAGNTYTMTNTADRRSLVNDPGTASALVLLCACRPNETCSICKRIGD